MKPAARDADVILCEDHVGGPGTVGALGRPGVFINGRPAIRLGDQADCAFASDVVGEGAAQVRIGNLPAVAVGHKSLHAAVVGSGAGDVNIGGPTFALPANLHVGGSAHFRNLVIRDLWLVSQTPTGEKMLARLAATGAHIRIEPGGRNEYKQGVVHYDPDFTAVSIARAGGGLINSPPQLGLAHELAHAVRVAERKATEATGDDMRDEVEESIVRGDGARGWEESISENRLRDDLGLPQRHGRGQPEREQQSGPIEGPEDLRPGGY